MMTTRSLFSHPRIWAHSFSRTALSHINLYFVPRSILRSYFALSDSNSSLSSLLGASGVIRMTQRVPSVARQMSLELLWCSSGTT
jgi:hypothetical protein